MMEQMKSFFDQEIGLFNKNYDSLAKKLDDTQNDIKNLSQKVESIENEVKVIRKDVDKIIEENQDSKINIENLSQKVEKIENEVKKIPLVIDHNWKISTASMGSFNGIIRQLTNECGGNAFEKKMVDITASSPANWGNLQNLVDLDSTEWFGTKDNENSWIRYDFKNKKVCPICYLIRSIAWNDNDHHPKSWVVEGSNSDSDNDWIVLDIKNDCSFLNGRSVVHCFSIQESKEFFRYLRIRQTDKNVSNNYCLAISTLEYFGSIKYT